MDTLSPNAKSILQLLVIRIREGRIVPTDPTTFVGYKEAHEELGISRVGYNWGASLSKQGLGDLAHWLHRNGRPAITGLVINKTTSFQPGDAYFVFHGRVPNDKKWWADQIRKAIAWDWSLDVEDGVAPTADELLEFTQAVNEGRAGFISVEVRERCEALRKRARQYHLGGDGKLRCLVCGWVKPDDHRIVGDIVELHHLQGLAELPRTGLRLPMSEAVKNLVPLCPCCHRVAHARREGRSFTIDELKKFIPPCASAALKCVA